MFLTNTEISKTLETKFHIPSSQLQKICLGIGSNVLRAHFADNSKCIFIVN